MYSKQIPAVQQTFRSRHRGTQIAIFALNYFGKQSAFEPDLEQMFCRLYLWKIRNGARIYQSVRVHKTLLHSFQFVRDIVPLVINGMLRSMHFDVNAVYLEGEGPLVLQMVRQSVCWTVLLIIYSDNGWSLKKQLLNFFDNTFKLSPK